jgi:hypothetical protein
MTFILPSFGASAISAVPGGGGGGASFPNSYALEFDGIDDYVDTGSTFQSTIRGGFTYSLWMKFESIDSGTYAPLGSWDDNADQNSIYISDPSAGASLTYRLEVGIPKITLTAPPVGGWSASDWYHVAVSVEQDSSNVVGKIYLNGVLGTTGTMTATLNNFASSRSIYIGARNRTNGSNIYFKGLIDEVALFNTALSASQITNIYRGEDDGGSGGTNGVPGDLSTFNSNNGPVGWWRMGDTGSDYGTATITDQGSGGNDGTIVNGSSGNTSPTYHDLSTAPDSIYVA